MITSILHTELFIYAIGAFEFLLLIFTLFFLYNFYSLRYYIINATSSKEEKDIYNVLQYFFLSMSIFSALFAIVVPIYIGSIANKNYTQFKSDIDGKEFTEYSFSSDGYKLYYSDSNSESKYVEVPYFIVVHTQGASEIDYGKKTGISIDLVDSGSALAPGKLSVTDYSSRGVRLISDEE